MAAKLVTGIAKVTQKILKAHKGKTLGKLSRVSSGFGRTATKLAKYSMIGKGIEAIANRNNNKSDTSLPALSDYDAVAASMAENNTADPIIGIPDLNIEEIIQPTAERVDLTVIEPVMGEVTVDPTSVVESYFDGDAAPITTDAIITIGTGSVIGTGSISLLDNLTVGGTINEQQISNGNVVLESNNIRLQSGGQLMLSSSNADLGVVMDDVLVLPQRDIKPSLPRTGSIIVSGSVSGPRPFFYDGTTWLPMAGI